jgi:hypothetical protein
MLKIENTAIEGWEPAIRGLRNPMNSWSKSDSRYPLGGPVYGAFEVGPNDLDLMLRMNATSAESKYRRMIAVWTDITAPLYWWKEFDTYKVGTVRNSCSTMHKIQEKEFVVADFSVEHLVRNVEIADDLEAYYQPDALSEAPYSPFDGFRVILALLNTNREAFLRTKDKKYWWQMIQLLPSSYNQRATVLLNYEVLAKQYRERQNHKLDEWHTYCRWIEALPYSELITGKTNGRKHTMNYTTTCQPKSDPVNHPSHYTAGKVECIDALESATVGLSGIEAVCTANAIKYLWRWKHKGGVEDLRKAVWYINRLISQEKGANS